MDWDALIAMGGYGGYVWPAYGVALVVLLAVLVQSVHALRRRRAALEALQPDDRRRRRAAAESPARPTDAPR
jgi:heme exporter protein D